LNVSDEVVLTKDQTVGKEKISSFLQDTEPRPDGYTPSTSFLLEGGAGVGKTFMLGDLLKEQKGGLVVVAAPTHKAINVLRRKMNAFGVGWCIGYDDHTYNGSDIITGTTAQLLGVAPIITEDQNEKEVKFGKTGRGLLSKITPELVVVDEVSMLGWESLDDLRKMLKSKGSKLLIIGDAGQLPPVKQHAVPFDRFANKHCLRQVVRQAEGSAIIDIAWRIREGRAWNDVEGRGVERVSDVAAAFLEAVHPAKAVGSKIPLEEDREVFIAYRNLVVNEVQEAACRKLLGHGPTEFAKGEVVLAGGNFYIQTGAGPLLVCANQDELVVESFSPQDRDPKIGIPVTMHRTSVKGSFTAFYLTAEEKANPNHPYNVELESRLRIAKALQVELHKTSRSTGSYNDLRKQHAAAWRSYYAWLKSTVLTFSHPYAITSHKSQGSTYRAVYADTGDLGRKSTQALYVAVTRPKEHLVIFR
jgi:hypothetical protein